MANHMERSRTHIATGSLIGWDVGMITHVLFVVNFQKLVAQYAHITAGNAITFLLGYER